MDLKVLDFKINELFDYREFPFLFEKGKTSGNGDSLRDLLFVLQREIYYLDEYLESNWNINQEDLAPFWNNINSALKTLNVNPTNFDLYTAHIRKYQKHELELRLNLMPTRFKLGFFYFYKSCDVKLLRRIIYDNLPNLKKEASLADWRFFDLITEINDDVEDVFEDLETINGNSFLISYFNFGEKSTREEYLGFCKLLVKKADERFNNSNKSQLQKVIHQKTILNIDLTCQAISENIEALKDVNRDNVCLFNNLNSKNKKAV